MRKEDTLRLNINFIAQRIERMELKQWLLAEMTGVSEKTVNRWLTGKVKRISRFNAEKLARQLECGLEEIVLRDETEIYATREEQRQAARLLEERDLIGLLSASDNWELAESLIKATMQPDLPLAQLGRLHNLLSITAWRMGRYDEGMAHAVRAREIGERTGEGGIIHRAICSIATIDSLLGRPAAALEGYARCLEQPELFESGRDHAGTHSNIAMVLRDFGRFEESIGAQRRSVELFEGLGLPFNLAISWTGMALTLIETGEIDEGERAVHTARAYAREAGFEKSLAATLLYLADCASLRGDHARALELAEEGMRGLERFDLYDLFCREIAVRVRRRAGDITTAEELYSYGLERMESFPVARGMMLQEGSRLAAAAGDAGRAELEWGRANGIFASMDLGARCTSLPVPEFGTLFDGGRSSIPSPRRSG